VGGAYEAALRMLAARALTVREIRQRLRRKGFQEPEITSAAARLVERGYLDDRALAYNVALARARRLYGRSRIEAELKRRGVATALAGEAAGKAFEELDEDELAAKAALKTAAARGRSGADPGGVARSLLRRGFPRGAVAKALRALEAVTPAGAGPAPRGVRRSRRDASRSDDGWGAEDQENPEDPDDTRNDDDDLQTDP
jgi:regulatory protein